MSLKCCGVLALQVRYARRVAEKGQRASVCRRGSYAVDPTSLRE